MKLIYVIGLASLLNSVFVSAQEIRTVGHKAASSATVAFGSDVVLDAQATDNQSRVRLATAFNGWQYAAVSSVNNLGMGGITLLRSIDGGYAWSVLQELQMVNILFPAFDLVVAGTDTSDLKVFLGTVSNNTLIPNYTLDIKVYNGHTGNLLANPVSIDKGTRRIYDVALASDYAYPAVSASPYSVAFLYSFYSSSMDSLVYSCSLDGGTTFGISQTVMTTGVWFQNVSLAYGRSASASNGRYFGAWEVMSSASARVGHIYTARSTSMVNSQWTVPKNLDSLSSTMINLCREPVIAVSYNNTDNDSSSCTAIVMVARDYNGDASDYDILGFYNKRAHYTNYWYRLDVLNSGDNDLMPHMAYHPDSSQFAVTYFDSTNAALVYCKNDWNLLSANSWNNINSQYNDSTTGMIAPWPRVSISPQNGHAAFAWIQHTSATHGVAEFDDEYLTLMVGIKSNADNVDALSFYPNPTSDRFFVSGNLKSNSHLRVELVNMLGQTMLSKDLGTVNAGTFNYSVECSSFENGNYIVKLIGDHGTKERKLVLVR